MSSGLHFLKQRRFFEEYEDVRAAQLSSRFRIRGAKRVWPLKKQTRREVKNYPPEVTVRFSLFKPRGIKTVDQM